MSTYPMAHHQDQGINYAVFGADARSRTDSARASLLADLTREARHSGLKVEKSALQFRSGGRLQFYGTPDLVKFLASIGGVNRWTHELRV